jgi:hypothetical protein
MGKSSFAGIYPPSVWRTCYQLTRLCPIPTEAAQNLLVIDDAEIARRYAQNWQEHLEHSVPYERQAKE